ncbi:MAG TPA: hypothetical protein VF438_01925 [Candidatus Paceibacterota bacterium]
MNFTRVKIVVTVPTSYADEIRDAAGKAGAGKIGAYSYCSFSVKGKGRYLPAVDAKPYKGKPGKLEAAIEARIEFTCDMSVTKEVIDAIKKVHPYEEVALDVYPLQDIS